MIGPYYTGQKPADPLVIKVNDEEGNVKDLSNYISAELILIDPAGDTVDVEGSTTITSNSEGIVTFEWPATSVLDEPGDYRYQLMLTDGTNADYTGIGSFEVYSRLGDN